MFMHLQIKIYSIKESDKQKWILSSGSSVNDCVVLCVSPDSVCFSNLLK